MLAEHLHQQGPPSAGRSSARARPISAAAAAALLESESSVYISHTHVCVRTRAPMAVVRACRAERETERE